MDWEALTLAASVGWLFGLTCCAVYVWFLLEIGKTVHIDPDDMDELKTAIRQDLEERSLKFEAKRCIALYCVRAHS